MITDEELRRFGLSAAAVALYGTLVRAAVTAALLVVIAGQTVVCWKIAKTTIDVRRMADFGVFYESARRARESELPYALSSNAEGRPTRPPNLTPPHVVAALIPLTLLSPAAALAIWAAASALSALAALALIFREAKIQPTARSVLLAAAAIVCAAPTGALLFAAQITWLLWGPATLAWARARHGRWTTAAVLLGVTASIKPFLLLFVIMFLRVGQRRAAALVLLTAAVCYAAGLAALGRAAFAGWFDALNSVSWAGHVWNGSALGFVERARLGSPHSSWQLAPIVHESALVLPLWVAVVAAIAIVSVRALPRDPRALTLVQIDRLFAVTLTASFLLSPLAWIYYDFLLAAPFVSLAATTGWPSRSRVAALAVASVAFVLTPGFLTAGQPSGALTLTLGSMYFWGVVALWGASIAGPQTQFGTNESASS